MIHNELSDTADPMAPVRREWHAPELRELPTDATAAGTTIVPDGPGSS